MLTAVALNWKRPDNVARVVESWGRSDLIERGIVWNNNPSTTLKSADVDVINTNRDCGLYTRFVAASLAKTLFVLIQDDDLILNNTTIELLYNCAKAEPQKVHGIFGRRPKKDGSYAESLVGNHDVPIVLTRALVASRDLVIKFLQCAPRFDDLQKGGIPNGNGEDIIFSYTAVKHSGELNRIYKLDVTELPAPDAIHKRPNHLKHRTRIMKACQTWVNSK